LNGFTDGLPALPSTAATAATTTAAAASTTTAAATAAAKAATTTAAARGSLTRLVDSQCAPLEILAVEVGNGGFCARIGRHLDKRKAARAATFPIHDQLGLGHFVARARE
jgi:hypothetical protein